MELKLNRFSSGAESTLGLLSVDGEFFCYSLEDQYNWPKVPKETRIPAGTYEITLRNVGGMIKRYKARFPWHLGMLWLRDVPGFQFIYIHVGNKDDDSEGCILVGDGQQSNVIERGQVSSSVAAYHRLYVAVTDAIAAGEDVSITITDPPVKGF